MSRSINSDKSWNSTDEEFDECDNSSNSNSINRRISGDDIPGGCITTHSVSSVIRPGSKMPRNDPLQFVKIQHNELSKKAVEQIKLAEEVKITKEKIKEVEEEWQNNLLNWKSKRRQSKSNSEDESGTSLASNRKTKTFSEILNEKAKSGHRIGYNLHKYIDGELENENELLFDFNNSYESNENLKNSDESYKSENESMNEDNNQTINKKKKNNSLGDVIVFDTSLLEEFSYNHKRQDSSEDSSIVNINSNNTEVINTTIKSAKSNGSSGDTNGITISNHNNNNYEINNKTKAIDETIDNCQEYKDCVKTSDNKEIPKADKVRVEINEWKHNNQRDNVLMYLLQQEEHQRHRQLAEEEVISHHNSSYDAEEDDEDDEELERLRLDQEKSFKAKLSAFESLAKQEETVSINNIQNNSNNKLVNNNNNKIKTRDDSKRPPPAVEELIHSEQQQLQQRPLYSGQYEDNDNDSDDVVNARIQQLHIERHRAQRQQPIQPQVVQQMPQQVYQPLNYLQSSQNPSQQVSHQTQPQQQLSQQQPQQQLSQQQQQQLSQQQQRHFDQQQYFLMDEPIVKQNQTPVISPKQIREPVVSPQIQHKQQLPYQQPIQPQEHLYVNQKQLLINQSNHPQYYDQLESHDRYGSPVREYYESSYEKPSQIPQQQTPETVPQQPQQHSQQITKESSYPSTHNQYLYYPKPYNANKSAQQVPIQKPVMVSQQQKPQPNQQTRQPSPVKHVKPQPPIPKSQNQPQMGYNQNHWLLQEAELRRQLASIPTQSSIPPSTVAATQRPTTSSSQKISSVPQKGMLSVSGKKKCSSCGDELGRGCAAMVVESLSLYYHINCFRCSVCNIQLGNGTVGTDVRVRNHKLHCQNCYSNDEAGLKFSRV